MENIKTDFWAEQVSNAPAWLISLAGHAILLLLATVIVFTSNSVIKEYIPIVISPPPIISEKLPDVPPPTKRDIFDNPTPPTSTEEPEDTIEKPTDLFSKTPIEAPEAPPHFVGKEIDLTDLLGNSGKGDKGIGRGDKGVGYGDKIGVGDGGGEGRPGTPTKCFPNRTSPNRPKTGCESAVEHALRWLCRHQDSNGGWSAASFASNCSGVKCSGAAPDEFSVGVSGLALLAFLGNGKTHLSKDIYEDRITKKRIRYGEVVKKAIQYLIAQQDSEGAVGKVGQKYMYNHSVATLALAEAYGMTGEKQFYEPARKAVDYLLSAQNRGGDENYDRKGWRYTYRSGQNDTSVMGWCVMALKSAEISGLFNGSGSAAYGGAISWVKYVTDDGNDYRVGYTDKGTGRVSVRGINDSWADHDALTAIGMLTRMFIEKNKADPALKGGARRLMMEHNIPHWDNSGCEKQIDYYHWYYASLALFQYDGHDEKHKDCVWQKWNEPMKKALMPNQHVTRDGCLDGSWDSEVDRWGFEGGRVYATAINALTLEVYYRYESIFMKK